jgi:hypothetical protein
LVDQGSLNRLIGSVHVASNADLNVTAPFLGADGISLTLDGDSVEYIRTMTGMVTSPEPFLSASVTIHLLKTQGLSLAWKTQLVNNALIGDVTVFPDTTTLLPFDFSNCAIQRIEALRFNGTDAGVTIAIRGIYYVNNIMWNLFTSTAA